MKFSEDDVEALIYDDPDRRSDDPIKRSSAEIFCVPVAFTTKGTQLND